MLLRVMRALWAELERRESETPITTTLITCAKKH
jgi:hypothetical protein